MTSNACVVTASDIDLGITQYPVLRNFVFHIYGNSLSANFPPTIVDDSSAGSWQVSSPTTFSNVNGSGVQVTCYVNYNLPSGTSAGSGTLTVTAFNSSGNGCQKMYGAGAVTYFNGP
jgi:hypothetical protein